MSDLTGFVALAEKLADCARTIVCPYFSASLDVIDKQDASPVTVADREAEAAMRALIEATYPDHGIFGEEHGVKESDSRYTWVLDPIDGTRSFISGVPLFGTLIGLLEDGKPVLGVIDMPMLKQRWIGQRGKQTLFNGAPVSVRQCQDLAQATLFCTDPHMFSPEELAAFRRVEDQVKLRRFSADCYGYGLLASGRIDLVVEADLKPYDVMALVPVIEGAGGIVSDWQGRAVDMNWDGRIVACGSKDLQAKVLSCLSI